jgi:hypothetical protein
VLHTHCAVIGPGGDCRFHPLSERELKVDTQWSPVGRSGTPCALLWISSGMAAFLFALAGCSGSTEPEKSSPNLGLTTQFSSADALLAAVAAAGQRCDDVRTVAPTEYMATLASCDSDVGQLDAYTFSDQSQQDRWHDTFKLICGNPIGDKYIRGDGWAIVAAERSNAGSQLAGSLGLATASFCDSNPSP